MFYGSDNEMSDNEFCIDDDDDNYENDSEYDEPKSYKVLLLLYN